MERRPSAAALRAGLALLATAGILVPVAVLGAMPPTDLAQLGLAWVVPATSATLGATAGLATVVALAAGLRTGTLVSLLLAGASAALAGGAMALLTGAATVIAAPIAVGSALVLGAAVAEREAPLLSGRRRRIVAACLLLLLAESAVLVDLAPGIGQAVAAYRAAILASAAGVAALAAILVLARDLAPAAAALAVGATALALARGGDVQVVAGLVALAGSSLLTARAVMGTGQSASLPEADVEHLPTVVTHVSEGVLRFDGHLRLRSWNPAAGTLLGLDEASAGARLEDLLGLSLAQLPAGSETVLHRTPVGGLELSIHRDASAINVVVHDPGRSSDAERLGRELRGTIEELLQARRTVELQRAEIERVTATDALTGVASRGAILDRLRIEVAEARRYQHSIAVVLLDIDRFGEVNTGHGIEGGDAVLREVALRVRLRVRAADAVGRFGSDGLLAILPHTDEGGAATFADALRQRIGQRPIAVGMTEVRVSLSGGLAVMRPGEALDVDGLLARATEALESARSAGGDRIALDRLHGLVRLERREPAGPGDASDHEGA